MTKPHTWESTPVINYGIDGMRVHHGRGEPRIARHKRLLGKQDYCWTGKHRYWVWEVPHRWRVYVSEVGGVGFEVACNLDAAGAKAALDDYLEKMQLTNHDCGHPLLCLEGTEHEKHPHR